MTFTVVGPTATRTSRVLWCLEELGLPFKRQIARPHSPSSYWAIARWFQASANAGAWAISFVDWRRASLNRRAPFRRIT